MAANRNNLIKTQDTPKKNPKISRRGFISGTACTLSAVATLGAIRYRLPGIFDGKEELKIVKLNKSSYERAQNRSIVANVPVKYVQFRNTVFGVYPVRAENDDTGPLSLIYKTNKVVSLNQGIKGDIDSRATDLFNILLRDKDSLEPLDQQIKSLKVKSNAATPIIHSGRLYEVPIPTAYKSLDDVVGYKS